METRTYAASSSSGCLKCGTFKKSGKRSCCARGGTWFRKCGDVGDAKLEHTWADGMQACRAFASSVSHGSRQQVKLPHVGVSAYTPSTTQLRVVASKRTNAWPSDRMFDAGIMDPEQRVGLAKVIVCTALTLIILQF